MTEEPINVLSVPEEVEAIPVGEEGIVTEGIEAIGDQMAIVNGEKPVFDVQISTWNGEGEPDAELPSVNLILAKNKKFYQRGLAELSIGGHRAIVHIDALVSCIYNVYDVQNPFEKYDPNKPMIKAYGVVKEEAIAETKDVPAHTKRELLGISMDKQGTAPFLDGSVNVKPVELILSIENVENVPVEEAKPEGEKA